MKNIENYENNFILSKSKSAAIYQNDFPQILHKTFIIYKNENGENEIDYENVKNTIQKDQKIIAIQNKNITNTVLEFIINIKHLYGLILKFSTTRSQFYSYFQKIQDFTKIAFDKLNLIPLSNLYEILFL